MKKGNFTEIKKKAANAGKHIAFILLGVLGLIIAGYFVYIGFQI